MVNAVVRAAKDLLHRAFAVDGKDKNRMPIKTASSVSFHDLLCELSIFSSSGRYP